MRSMLAHPAGKGLLPPPAQSLLDALTAPPPMDAFEEEVHEVLAGLADLLVSKQEDYGPHAISRSPGGALNGINVRMHDKFMRAQHLRRTGIEPNHESLRDTYADLANYAVIAVMVLDGTWPE